MLQLRDLPNALILGKFAERYGEVDVDAVLHFLSILRIGTDLSEALDGFLARHGLLQGRWWVLILLMREDDLTSNPSRLAEKSGVSRATMTRLLDGLAREGLVKRLDDRNDRRKYTIRLTPAGQAKLDEVMPDYYPRVKRMMEVLSAAQREQLLQNLLLLKERSTVFE
ncbi:MAG: MarR family transcriptional regulator [Gammaproteobacteria bacterium]